MRIAWFGSSLVSAYWNGAATYYRGLVRALHARGHQVTFLEPDAWRSAALGLSSSHASRAMLIPCVEGSSYSWCSAPSSSRRWPRGPT